MKIRYPYVSGKFYPADKKELEELIYKIYNKEKGKIKCLPENTKIIGGIVPHAGYIFSAYEAVHFFENLRKNIYKYDTVVIINPSHTGYGDDISLDINEAWRTPFGDVLIDNDFYDKLQISRSEEAHKYEHSGEVILPFLQYFLKYDFKIVPITFKMQNYRNAVFLANELYRVSEILKKKILVIASSDFSHYVEPKYGQKQDKIVIDEIYKFDSGKIYNQIYKYDISVCGYGPIMTLLEFAKLQDEKIKIEMLRQGNSGEIMPSDEVVDYYSFIAYKSENKRS